MKILAVDFGGTRIKAGVVSGGKVIASFLIDVPSNPTLAEQLPQLKVAFLKLPNEIRDGIEAIAFALPVIVAADQLTVTRVFGKYDDSPHFPLTDWCRAEFGLPVILENDAKAAALGEWQSGAGQGCKHLVMVTLGTGIGTAVISDGALLHGHLGSIGNLGGHIIVEPSGRPCICGMSGCFETQVATWALPEITRSSPGYATSQLASCPVIDYRQVFQLAKADDSLALELRNNAFHYWGLLLTNLITCYDPEAIILGGGIMAGKDDILPTLRQTLHEQLNTFHQNVRLLPATLGDNAALTGLCHAWSIHHQRTSPSIDTPP